MWSRRRLAVVLSLSLVGGLGVVAGVVLVIAGSTGIDEKAPSSGPAGETTYRVDDSLGSQEVSGSARELTSSPLRLALAASPMARVPDGAMWPAEPDAAAGSSSGASGASGAAEAAGGPPETVGGTLENLWVPPAADLGPAGVVSGFPQTPEGAVAQLAAIERTVLSSMDVDTSTTVHAAWVAPNGVLAREGSDLGAAGGGEARESSWGLTDDVAAFVERLDAGTARGAARGTDGGRGSPGAVAGLQVAAEPVAGMVKASDGADWVVACVLMQVRASYVTTGQVAYGRCEPMVWTAGRWVLDGQPVAAAPSTWPGTAVAARAGWQPFALGGARAPWTTTLAPRDAGAAPSTRDVPDSGSSSVSSTGSDINAGTESGTTVVEDPGASPLPSSGAASPETGAGGDGGDGRTGAGLVDVDLPNPLGELGGLVSGVAADAWTSAMLALWGGGLWLLRLVLNFADTFLTPDLSEAGPGRNAYVSTFWLASVLVLVMALVQLGVAAFKRESGALARVLVGLAQFAVVWSCWLGYCVVIVAACGELTRALMGSLLGVETWRAWDPVPGLEAGDVTDSAVATVLGLLGCVLWLAALGHLLVMLARAASLIVLVATGPIAAAGLVAEAGRSWFWKSLRWFHAAAMTPLLMVLVLGVGTQVSAGVASGLADSTQAAVGTALPAVLLLCVACVAPLALFKLLSFVDPGTSSGAAFRQGLAAQGGLQGLLTGSSSKAVAGAGGMASSMGSTAAQTDAHGRSGGEADAEGATSARFGALVPAGGGGALGVLGGVGKTIAAGMGAVQKAGSLGTSLLGDESNQSGVGHHTHTPDFSALRGGPAGAASSGARGRGVAVGEASGGGSPGAASPGEDPGRSGGGGPGGSPTDLELPTGILASLAGSVGGPVGLAASAPGGVAGQEGTAGQQGGTQAGTHSEGAGAARGAAAAVPPVPPVPI